MQSNPGMWRRRRYLYRVHVSNIPGGNQCNPILEYGAAVAIGSRVSL